MPAMTSNTRFAALLVSLLVPSLGPGCHSGDHVELHAPVAVESVTVVEADPPAIEHKLPAERPQIGEVQEDGWSRFEKTGNTRVVYVSSSEGKDSYPGTSAKRPKKSLAAAKELLRDGRGDWLLLRRGDVFRESLGQWKKSGRSTEHPLLISTFGDDPARPRLETGTSPAISTHGGGGSPKRIDHIALVGLHFTAHEFDGRGDPAGVSWHQPCEDFLIEDCVFENYSTGLVIQAIDGRHENFRLRRSAVYDCYNNSGGNPQGIYVVHVDGVLIEECVFDRNGWKPGLSGAGADIFSHNLYIDTNNSGVIVRGNVIARGASHGVQMRSGGLCEGNLFVQNSIALMMAGRAGPERESAVCEGNVIVHGKDIDARNPRGWGIDFNNVVSGRIASNLIAHNVDGGFPIPILIDGDGHGHHVHDVEITGNVIHDWGGSIQFNGDDERLSNIRFTENRIQNTRTEEALVWMSTKASSRVIRSGENRFHSERAGKSGWMTVEGNGVSVKRWRKLVEDRGSTDAPLRFPHPERTLWSYHASVKGEPTLEAFLEEARRQSRENWREEVTAAAANAWLREGYGL